MNRIFFLALLAGLSRSAIAIDCAHEFEKIPAVLSDTLEDLSKYLSTRQNFLSGHHSMVLQDGRGYLKIGMLRRRDLKFQKLVLAAIKEGKIAEVNAGDVVGPKVLELLDTLRKIRPQNGQSFTIRGTLYPKDFLERYEAEVAASLNGAQTDVNPTLWNKDDIDHFQKAVEKFGIEKACLEIWNLPLRGGCKLMKFSIEIPSPPGQMKWMK